MENKPNKGADFDKLEIFQFNVKQNKDNLKELESQVLAYSNSNN